MIAVKRLATDLIALLFPELCNACGTSLYYGEKEICTSCLADLPYTDYHTYEDNRVAKQLWARLPCNAAMAMLYFKKGTKVQHLIHNLKYNGKTDVGIRLGNLLGEKLKLSRLYNDIDLIIPVPLHQTKQKTRGFNQSECIGIGVAENLGITMSANHLIRNKFTDTQTKKSRYTRYENMTSVFSVINAEQIRDKHILLIDDVITTGATLEACGNELIKCGIKKLSIAAIAFAE